MYGIRKNASSRQLTSNEKTLNQDDRNIAIARKSSSIMSVKRCKSANTASFRRKDEKCKKQRKKNHFQVKPNLPIKPCLSGQTEKCYGDFKPKLKVQFSLPLTTDMLTEQKEIKNPKDKHLLDIPAFKELNKLKLTKSQTNLPNNVSKKSQKSMNSHQKVAISESKTNLAHKVSRKTQNAKISYQKVTVSDTSLKKLSKQQIKSVKSSTNEYDNLKLEAKIYQLRAKSRKLKKFIDMKDNRSQEFPKLKQETRSVITVIKKKSSLNNIIDKTKLLSVSAKHLIRFNLMQRGSNFPVKKHNKNQTELKTNKYDTNSCKDSKYNEKKDSPKTQKYKTSSKSPCSPYIKRNLATRHKYEENKTKPQCIRKLNYDKDIMAFFCNVPDCCYEEIRARFNEQKGKVKHTNRKQNNRNYQNGRKVTFWKKIKRRFLSFSSVEANESDSSSSISMDKKSHYYDEEKESNSLSRRNKNKIDGKKYQRYYTYRHNRDDSIGKTNKVARYPKSEGGETFRTENADGFDRNIPANNYLVDAINSPCHFDVPCSNVSCQTFDTVSQRDECLQTRSINGIKLTIMGTKTQENPSLYAWSRGKILKPARSCDDSRKFVTEFTQTPLTKSVSLLERKDWGRGNREGKNMGYRKESREKTEHNEWARKEWEHKARELKELEGNPREREKWERELWEHKGWQGKGNRKELDRREWDRKEQEHKDMNGKMRNHKEWERMAREINEREGKEGYLEEWVRNGWDRKRLDRTEWQDKEGDRKKWDREEWGHKESERNKQLEDNVKMIYQLNKFPSKQPLSKYVQTETETNDNIIGEFPEPSVCPSHQSPSKCTQTGTSAVYDHTKYDEFPDQTEVFSVPPYVMTKQAQSKKKSKKLQIFSKKTAKRNVNKMVQSKEKRSNKTYSYNPRIMQKSLSSRETVINSKRKSEKGKRDYEKFSSQNQYKGSKNNINRRSRSINPKEIAMRSRSTGTGVYLDPNIAIPTCKKRKSLIAGAKFPIEIIAKEANTEKHTKSTVCKCDEFHYNTCKITPCKKHNSGSSSERQVSRDTRGINIISSCSKCKINPCAKCKKKPCVKHKVVHCQKCKMKPCSKCGITACKKCTLNICKKNYIHLCKKYKTISYSNHKVCPCMKSKFPCTETCKHHKACKKVYKTLNGISKRIGNTAKLIGYRPEGTGTRTSHLGPCIREGDVWDSDSPMIRKLKRNCFGKLNENEDWIKGQEKMENNGPKSGFGFGRNKDKGEMGNNGDNELWSGENNGENGPWSGRNNNGGDGNKSSPGRNKNKGDSRPWYRGDTGPSSRGNYGKSTPSLGRNKNKGDDEPGSRRNYDKNDARSGGKPNRDDDGTWPGKNYESLFRIHNSRGDNRPRSSGYHGENDRWSGRNNGYNDPLTKGNKYKDGGRRSWFGKNKNQCDNRCWSEKTYYGENDPKSGRNKYRGDNGPWLVVNYGGNDPRSGGIYGDNDPCSGRNKGYNDPRSKRSQCDIRCRSEKTSFSENDPRSEGKKYRGDNKTWPGGNYGKNDPRSRGNYGENNPRSKGKQNRGENGPWYGRNKSIFDPRSGKNKHDGKGGKKPWFGRKKNKGDNEPGYRTNYDKNDPRSGGKPNRYDDGTWPGENYGGNNPRSGGNYGETDPRSRGSQNKGEIKPWSGGNKGFNDPRSGGNTNRGKNRTWSEDNRGYNDPRSDENKHGGEGVRKSWFGRKKNNGDNEPGSRRNYNENDPRSGGKPNRDDDGTWHGENYGRNDPRSRGNENKSENGTWSGGNKVFSDPRSEGNANRGANRPWADGNWGYNDPWDSEHKGNGEGRRKFWFGRKKNKGDNEPGSRRNYNEKDPRSGGKPNRDDNGTWPRENYGGNDPRSGGNNNRDDDGPWRREKIGNNYSWPRGNIDGNDPWSKAYRNRRGTRPLSENNNAGIDPRFRVNKNNADGRILPWFGRKKNLGGNEPWAGGNNRVIDPRSRGNIENNVPWTRGNRGDNEPWSRGNRGDNEPWSRGNNDDRGEKFGPNRNRRETVPWSGRNYEDNAPWAAENRNIGGDGKRSWFGRNRNKDKNRRWSGKKKKINYDEYDSWSRGNRYDDVDGGNESMFVGNRNNNRVRNISWFGRNRTVEENDTNVNRSWVIKTQSNGITIYLKGNEHNAGKRLSSNKLGIKNFGGTGDRGKTGVVGGIRNNIKKVFVTIATEVWRSMFKSKTKYNRRNRKRKPIECMTYNDLGFPRYYPKYKPEQLLRAVLFVLACAVMVPFILCTALIYKIFE